jgi:hypothetical protein
MITLSISDLRSILDVDDDLQLERAWLLRNTAASADCTVIRQELADQIREQDPEGVIIKLVSYPVNLFEFSAHLQRDTELFIPHKTKSLAVHTAWTPITWKESQENARLSKYENSEWRRNLKQRETCIEEASTCASRLGKLLGKNTESQFFQQIVDFAVRTGYDVEKLKAFIAEVDKSIT